VKEKELRIALVCYGGVSLAVYMHGVTKELWKLVKASQLHRDHAVGVGDTEQVYLDLLRRLGEQVNLRVLIDVVAGSSAGGINGILLARGLAHDMPLDSLTDLWLDNADVTRLLAPDKQAGKWSKWFLYPFLYFGLRRLKQLAPDQEVRNKLSLFIRSRWFEPPFSGSRLMEMLLDAAYAMGQGASPARSLMPAGLPLSLFVTVTDFYGYRQSIAAHDPPLLEEREHRHVFSFSFRRAADGRVESDFDDASVPGLAFAARATSAFPGAFPPAQLNQIDRLLERRGGRWPARAGFLARNFRIYRMAGLEPEGASFIDGSVLNNKPFAEALAAISGRPAFREVDRRILYIDPNPHPPPTRARRETPGWFRTIRGALSDIPRNEPVRDELAAIAESNRRVARLRGVLDAAKPRVRSLVEEVLEGPLPDAPTVHQVRQWREAAGSLAARAAGFAYEAYVRLKIDGVLDRLLRQLMTICALTRDGPQEVLLQTGLRRWAEARGVIPEWLETPGLTADGRLPRWVDFLRNFDCGFRMRRLRFVVRELNHLYEEAGRGIHADTKASDLDELKSTLYGALEDLRRAERTEDLPESLRESIRSSLLPMLKPPDVPVLDDVLAQLAQGSRLEALSQEMDEIFAVMGLAYMGTAAREDLFLSYLGFGFWDVLAFSTSGWRELDEFHAMKVDRIAPEDARLLRAAGAPVRPRGARLNMFGAFFSRPDREHDYLLGRLQAAERAIDMVIDCAGPDCLTPDEITAFKLRAFRQVVTSERPRLGESCPAIATAEGWLAACETRLSGPGR
jgi:patatin-related protein